MSYQFLLDKLQLKDEKNLLIQGMPSSIEKQFVKLTFAKSVTPLLKIRKIDFALIFAVSQNQLVSILKEVLPVLQTNSKLWVAYPKTSSKIASDLNREANWHYIHQCGFESVDVVTLDNIWTAVQFKSFKKAAEKKNIHIEIVAQ